MGRAVKGRLTPASAWVRILPHPARLTRKSVVLMTQWSAVQSRQRASLPYGLVG